MTNDESKKVPFTDFRPVGITRYHSAMSTFVSQLTRWGMGPGGIMNRYWIWGLSCALVAGMGALALAGDPNMQPNQTTLVQYVSNMFSSQSAKSSGAGSTVSPPTITAPLAHDVLVKCVKDENEALLRRTNICEALRNIAAEKGDTALARKADDLERQANSLYNARIAALGVPKFKAPAEPKQPVLPRESETSMPIDEPAPVAPTAPVPSAKIYEVRP
jgi:hypothetical protein